MWQHTVTRQNTQVCYCITVSIALVRTRIGEIHIIYDTLDTANQAKENHDDIHVHSTVDAAIVHVLINLMTTYSLW